MNQVRITGKISNKFEVEKDWNSDILWRQILCRKDTPKMTIGYKNPRTVQLQCIIYAKGMENI